MPEQRKRNRVGVPRQRWTLAAVAAAISAWTVQAPAATYTWVGGNGGDPTNYNDAANWSPNPAAPGSADIAYFNTSASNQPTLASSASLGELDFNTAGWQLGGGTNVLTLNGVSGVGILSGATTGLNQIGVNLDVAAAQTWQVATGGTLQIDGIISDSNALTIGATGLGGTVLLTNANTYSGALTLNAGTLELGGATINATPQFGQLQSVSSITLAGGTFLVNNTNTGGGNGNQNNRIQSTAPLNFAGGSFVYQGSNTTASSDSAGAVTLSTGPIGAFTVSANAGANSAIFTVASLAQSYDGVATSPLYVGSLLVNGKNLGTTGGNVLVTTAPTLIGTTSGTGSDNVGVYNTQIVPFLVGEVSTGTTGTPAATGAGGTAFGTPNTFLTYSSTTGLRPLNPVDEFASTIDDGSTGGTATLGDNVYLTSNQAAVLSANNSINSLVINGAGSATTPVLTIPDETALNLASGSLLFVSSGGIQPSSSTGILDFGSNNNVNITVLAGQTATIGAQVTGTGSGINVSGGGSLLLTASNTFSNGVTANGTNVTFGSGSSGGWNPQNPLPGDALVVAANGSATFNGSSSIVSGGSGFYTFNIIAGSLTVNGTLNATVSSDASPQDNIYLYLGPGSTFTNNGSTTFAGVTVPLLSPGSAINDNGSLTFESYSSTSPDSAYIDLENGATLNVGSPTNSSATFTVSEPSGIAISPGTGGVGHVNVYGSFTLSGTSLAVTDDLRLGADKPGAEIMTIYSGGSATFAGLMLADNDASTPVSGILGAIFVNSGGVLGVSANTGTGVADFSIGAAGGGTAGANNFGYVSVASNASIGPYSTAVDSNTGAVANAPGTIDIGGAFRTVVGVGGGNGLLEVNGGTVTVNEYTYMARSTLDPQYAQLDLLNGATYTINNGKTGGSILQMSAGTLGSSSVINVVNSALNIAVSLGTTDNNDAINLIGTTGNSDTIVTAAPTGILNINGSASRVTSGYVRAGTISFALNATYYSGDGNTFINFNGGKLRYGGAAASQSTFVQYGIAGAYVYAGGAVVGGGGDPGLTYTPGAGVTNPESRTGFDAPPGNGISTISVTNGGSGYLTPPIVVITDSLGFDATGYATINSSGQVTGVSVTNPGFNMTNPTITFIGGGGSGAAATAVLAPNTSGGLIKQDAGTIFTLLGQYSGTNSSATSTSPTTYYLGSDLYSFTSSGILAPSGAGNNPYASGYGNAGPGIRNNTSTYTGPTVVEAGTLALNTSASSGVTTTTLGSTSSTSLYAAGKFAATNNNIPFSNAIIVGDTAADATNNGAVLDITGITGAGGSKYQFQLSPGLTNGSYTTGPQVLAGFGTITGSSNVSLNIGLAPGATTSTGTSSTSTGNNFGGFTFANGLTSAPSVNNSVVSPGYTSSGSALVVLNNTSQYQANSSFGTIVVGSSGGGTPTVAFNTRQGNAVGGPPAATGALTIGGGTSTTTVVGAGGTYYWKLDLTNGGAGVTQTPGTATVSPGLSGQAPAAGAAWDELIMDNVSVNSTITGSTGFSLTTGTSTSAFTIEAVGFSSGNSVANGSTVSYTPGPPNNPIAGGTMGTTSYSWIIGRSSQPYVSLSAQALLASLSLDTTGLPAPAPGYEYFLSAQADPSADDTDLVINYAGVPEPAGCMLLGFAAGGMMIRRRRLKRPFTVARGNEIARIRSFHLLACSAGQDSAIAMIRGEAD